MKNNLLIILLIITPIVVLLSGCASLSSRKGFSHVEETVKSRINQRTYWKQGSNQDVLAGELMHNLLKGKLSVEEAVQVALLNNPGLQAEYEELGIAQAELVEAGLLENPVFKGSFRFPEEDGKTNTEFEVEQNFLDLLFLPLRKKIAKEQLEQAKMKVTDAVLELAAEVKRTYFHLIGEKQMYAYYEQYIQAAQAQLELAERQYKEGNINELIFSQHQSDYRKARLVLMQLKSEVIAHHEKLARLMGLSMNTTNWETVEVLPDLAAIEPELDYLTIFALSNRLDLTIAQKERDILKRSLSLLKFGGLTDVDIGVNTEEEPDGSRVTGPIVGMDVPLFDRGQTRRARLLAQIRQSEHNIEALQQDILSEVKTLYNELQTAREMTKYYQESVIPLHEKIVRLSLKEYNYMLHGVYDLLRDKQEEIDIRREYVESLKNYWVVRSELERATGGGWHQEYHEGGKR